MDRRDWFWETREESTKRIAAPPFKSDAPPKKAAPVSMPEIPVTAEEERAWEEAAPCRP